MPRFLHHDLVKLFFRITQIPDVYQKEHGECPSKWALPDEDRCPLAGEWSNTDTLLFSHHRYIVGQLVGIENGAFRRFIFLFYILFYFVFLHRCVYSVHSQLIY